LTVIPELTEADPAVAGEGSLDPLGLASLAEQLAEQLLPSVRARMQRIRFVTASAVGALASEGLHDIPPEDRVSTPSLCFEWLVLASFAKTNAKLKALDASGVPGSSKTWSVYKRGERLSARNYLKSPGVFGFTGVYLPLARDLRVLDDARRSGPQSFELIRAWELDDPDFRGGFVDGATGSSGQAFRKKLRVEIESSLRSGHCSLDEGKHLVSQIAGAFHPERMGQHERSLYRRWLTDDESNVRSEVARLIGKIAGDYEFEMVASLLSAQISGDLRRRLTAIRDYELVANTLTSAFRELARRSTVNRPTPMEVGHLANDEVLGRCFSVLPSALTRAEESLGDLEGGLAGIFQSRLVKFFSLGTVGDFAESLMAHHEDVQARKPPAGKRPWFEQADRGWVIRDLYKEVEDIEFEPQAFVHPYRLYAMKSFLKDVAP
jgi:hypothetical protein